MTELEACAALALPSGADRSCWLHRRFDGGVTLQQDPRRLLDDGSDGLAPLKEHMRQRLSTAGAGRVEEAAVTAESRADRWRAIRACVWDWLLDKTRRNDSLAF